MSLPNKWHLRRVAENAAKACYICYKPSSSVLITPDNKDFFYVCPAHLKDRNFCSPIVDSEEQARKAREDAIAREVEAVKKEYEEKQLKKKEKEKDKDKGKEKEKEKGDDDSKDKNEKKKDDEQSAKSEKEKDDKIDAIKNSGTATQTDNEPRIFSLHKNFYQMRVDRLRNMEAARRNRERLKDPSLFPSAPSGEL